MVLSVWPSRQRQARSLLCLLGYLLERVVESSRPVGDDAAEDLTDGRYPRVDAGLARPGRVGPSTAWMTKRSHVST